MKPLWIVVFQGLTLLIILAGVLDLPETLPFFLELITHFRTQYALFSLILILFFLLQGNRLFLILAIGAFLLHFTGLLKWSIPGSTRNTTGEELRVLVFNVKYSNRQHSRVLQEIQAANAHVVGILELSHTWKLALSPLEEVYPYTHHLPRDDGFGLGIYSMAPLDKTDVLHLGEVPVPTLIADLRMKSGPVHIVLTHSLPPVSPEYFHLRNRHLFELAVHMKESKSPKMIMGDLNVTMFSPNYRTLERVSRLQNARKGFGIVPTWPDANPLLAIPIDHVLVDQSFNIVDFRSGNPSGSDHSPILAVLTRAEM